MRLTPDVLLVGGGPVAGFGLSGDGDAHCYVLDGGDEVAIVDCGMGAPTSLTAILDNLAADGLDPARASTLLLTHYHTDHAGGAARFRARLGLSVHAAREAGDAIERGDARQTGLEAGQRMGVFPVDYVLEPCPVDRLLTGGEVLSIGRLTVRVVPTPGHSAGHLAYLVEGSGRSLLTGDSVFQFGRVLLQAVHDCDLQASVASIRAMSALEFDAFLPGHGGLALSGGHAHIDMAVAAIERGFPPPNLL